MKPSNPTATRPIWIRFRDDERSSAHGRWSLMAIPVWLLLEMLLPFS